MITRRFGIAVFESIQKTRDPFDKITGGYDMTINVQQFKSPSRDSAGLLYVASDDSPTVR